MLKIRILSVFFTHFFNNHKYQIINKNRGVEKFKDQKEIVELKGFILLSIYQKYQRISYNKIDYTFMEN